MLSEVAMNSSECSDMAEGLCRMGCAIINSGGEIYRAEDTMKRIAAAYNVSAEVFVVPNCVIVKIKDDEGRPITSVQRSKMDKVNITYLENLNNLSRRICADPSSVKPEQLIKEIKKTLSDSPSYSLILILLGYGLGAFCYCIYCSGGVLDSVFAAIAAAACGITNIAMSRLKMNFFVNLIVSSCVLGLVVYGLHMLGLPLYIRAIMSGSIMILVPGLAFTSFMTSMLSDDISSGLAIFAKTILTAVGLAIGSGAAYSFLSNFSFNPSPYGQPVHYHVIVLFIVTFLSCLGFIPTFNVRGRAGILLSCLGGTLAYAVFLGVRTMGCGEYFSYFIASIAVSFYSQICARTRHFPVTSYLVISYLPLVPGLRIYEAMSYYINNDIPAMAYAVFETIAISSCIAIGTLLVSTFFKIITDIKTGKITR